ncbi:integron integrase [Candidatus Pacearchaeota archaeon]|nr:integron integrase [Candidatus Pacearchaeota archaeon]
MNKSLTIEKVRKVIKVMHKAKETEKAYVRWISQYIDYLRDNPELNILASERKMEAFLTYLALGREVSASTQNQAFNAILFLYRNVIGVKLDDTINAVRAKKSSRLPSVLTQEEVQKLLDIMNGTNKLIASFLYGCGLRLTEGCSMRIKDLDFEGDKVYIRAGKGDKDRVVMMPQAIKGQLWDQVEFIKRMHDRDMSKGNFEGVELPNALDRKYPKAPFEIIWQYLFPANNRRYHAHKTGVQRAVRIAAKKANIEKRVSPHVFRHSFATHMLENGYNVVTVQKLLGHKDLKATQIYLHVMQKGTAGIYSPLDKEAMQHITSVNRGWKDNNIRSVH